MSFRAIIAIIVCKLLRGFSRIVNRGGTAMPGRIALKICPDLLGRLAKSVNTVAVTGTNGKTTSARMMEEAFSKAGLPYFTNRSGANLISGITTEFVMNCTLGGKMKKSYAVIECDEAASRAVFRQLKPRVVVVTNLFRDQLDRYGEVTHTLSNIREGLTGAPDATLCLNADCSLTSSLAGDLPNKVVYFGIDGTACTNHKKPEVSDATHCIRCKSEYEYDYISYGHLGGFRCPKCGYRRQKTDYAVTDLVSMESDSSTVIMRTPEGKKLVTVNLPAMYNIYNAIGALAACGAMGIAEDKTVEALSEFKCGFGRMESFALGGGAKMMLVKNPAGCNQVIDYLKTMDKRFILVICLNDRGADGTDISWVWDADFEALKDIGGRIEKIIVSGDRAWDMAVRIKYAGISDKYIQVERDYEKLVSSLEAQNESVLMMPTYTAMLELRQVLIKHCGGAQFWE